MNALNHNEASSWRAENSGRNRRQLVDR